MVIFILIWTLFGLCPPTWWVIYLSFNAVAQKSRLPKIPFLRSIFPQGCEDRSSDSFFHAPIAIDTSFQTSVDLRNGSSCRPPQKHARKVCQELPDLRRWRFTEKGLLHSSDTQRSRRFYLIRLRMKRNFVDVFYWYVHEIILKMSSSNNLPNVEHLYKVRQ